MDTTNTNQVREIGDRPLPGKLRNVVRGATWHSLKDVEKNELHALLTDTAKYVDHPIFQQPDVEELLIGDEPDPGAEPTGSRSGRVEMIWSEEWLGQGVRRLTADEEVRAFQRYNYARYRVCELITPPHRHPLDATAVRELLTWGRRELAARDQITVANIPLVIALARGAPWANVDQDELVSAGYMSLLRSVARFDCSRGVKFSTYAYPGITRSFWKVAMDASKYKSVFAAQLTPDFGQSDYHDRRQQQIESECLGELQLILGANAAELSDVERTVVDARYPLSAKDGNMEARNFQQIGALIGKSKEQARQIHGRALKKLRAALERRFLAA